MSQRLTYHQQSSSSSSIPSHPVLSSSAAPLPHAAYSHHLHHQAHHAAPLVPQVPTFDPFGGRSTSAAAIPFTPASSAAAASASAPAGPSSLGAHERPSSTTGSITQYNNDRRDVPKSSAEITPQHHPNPQQHNPHQIYATPYGHYGPQMAPVDDYRYAADPRYAAYVAAQQQYQRDFGIYGPLPPQVYQHAIYARPDIGRYGYLSDFRAGPVPSAPYYVRDLYAPPVPPPPETAYMMAQHQVEMQRAAAAYVARRDSFERQQQDQQKKHPTDFGPSFDFGTDFDISGPGSDITSPPYSPRVAGHLYHQPVHQTFSNEFKPMGDERLSPNNPFNPVFNPYQEQPPPPPRPPARIVERTVSIESSDSGPPPPLPKRRPVTSNPTPAAANNWANFDKTSPIKPSSNSQNIYAYIPDIQQQSAAMDAAPPLPLPSRKRGSVQSVSSSASSMSAAPVPDVLHSLPRPDRKVSFDTTTLNHSTSRHPLTAEPFDPFNVAYIDKHLFTLNKNSTLDSSDSNRSQKVTSTPVTSSSTRPESLPYSSIHGSEAATKSSILPSNPTVEDPGLSISLEMNSSSVFASETSNGSIGEGYERLEEDAAGQNKIKTRIGSQNNVSIGDKSGHEMTQRNDGPVGGVAQKKEDHLSPPERNIFRPKDPFADDDFFSS